MPINSEVFRYILSQAPISIDLVTIGNESMPKLTVDHSNIIEYDGLTPRIYPWQ